MTAEERELRGELSELAETDNGRRLLQLALRGIDGGEAELTAGCWTDRGIAGLPLPARLLAGRPRGRLPRRGPAGRLDRVVRRARRTTQPCSNAIGSFDRLAKRHHADRTPRRILPDRVEIRTDEWRRVVGRMLVETLSDSQVASTGRNPVPA